MTMNSGDFSEFQGFRYPRTFRAPRPFNLPSLKGEALEREALGLPDKEPRALTYLTYSSVKSRVSTSTLQPSLNTTPHPSPTPNTTPPAPINPTKTSTKICSACRLPHEKSHFSKKQWSAGKGRKCSDCVQPQAAPVVTQTPPQHLQVQPVKPNPPSVHTETLWDTIKANNDAKFEEEAGLMRLAVQRQSRKPARIPPRPPAPAPVYDAPIVPRIRHKICPTAKKGFRCKIGDSCEGAHSLQEYAPPSCSWGVKCRHVKASPDGLVNVSERPCSFIHPGESQDHYHKRSGRHAPRFWTQ